MDWFEDVIETHFPTRESLFEYLYDKAKDCSVAREAIPMLEERKGLPLELWRNYHKTYHKICFAMSATVDTKSSGDVLFFYPNGTVQVRLTYNNGIFVPR